MSDIMMSRKEVADYLQVSLVTLHNLNKKGILKPSHRVGRQPRYLKSELLEQIQLSNYQRRSND